MLPPMSCDAKYSGQGGEFPVTVPPPQAGKSMPAPLEAAMVPADLPASLRIRVRDWTLPKSRCPDSSPILQTARALPYSARQRANIQGNPEGHRILMVGIRHGRGWIYSCPGTIRVSLGHYAPHPPVFSSCGCLSGWAPPKLLQTFAYRWCYLSSPQSQPSQGGASMSHPPGA